MEAFEIREFGEEVSRARTCFAERMKEKKIPDTVVRETLLIFEELCSQILTKNPGTVICAEMRERLGQGSLLLSFSDKTAPPDFDGTDDSSLEGSILRGYGERIGFNHKYGRNEIRIAFRYSSMKSVISGAVAILLALLLYGVLLHTTDADERNAVLYGLFVPLEKLFGNAILMIGAPVTFFSLVRNLTGAILLAERSSVLRKIYRSCILSSLIAMLLALGADLIGILAEKGMTTAISDYSNLMVESSFPEFISSLLPSDIFSPFQEISPFPLIVFAIMLTYALCSVGRYFESIKGFMDASYELFSRILSLVMATLPFFMFAAMMDILLSDGIPAFGGLAVLLIVTVLCLGILNLYYAIRLRRKKIRSRDFFRALLPLLRENMQIGSTIDAVPLNVRRCMKIYKMDRRYLQEVLPLLAQINLDGNCFMITFVAVAFTIVSGTHDSLMNMFTIGLLVFFLSFGAPNQPGSFLIAMVIILEYMHADTLIPLAIFCEFCFGSLLNLVNTTGDIVIARCMANSVNGKPGSTQTEAADKPCRRKTLEDRNTGN